MSQQHPTAERLNAFLLGELETADREAMATHLRACAPCRAEVASLEAALAAYRAEEPEAVDEMALGRLLAAARPARSGPTARPRWVDVAVAAAAAVVIFLGGFWAGQQGAGDELRPAVPAGTATPADAEPRPLDPEPPTLRFAAADADLLGGLAPRDTTWH